MRTVRDRTRPQLVNTQPRITVEKAPVTLPGAPGARWAPPRPRTTPSASTGPASTDALLACASLRDSNALLAEWLGSLEVGCTFSEDAYLDAERNDPRLAVLPVLTEAQAQRLATLMERCPGTSVLGVVMDVTGHHTHRAIQHGASWVLNTLLPPECCLNLLRMVIQAVVPQPVPETAELPVQPPAPLGTPAEAERDLPRLLDEQEEELLALLCGPASIAEIAKRFYCSERSMYRQLRRLYRRYGVTGRRHLRQLLYQLRHKAARSDPGVAPALPTDTSC